MKPKRTILAVACSVTLAFGCVASERGDTQPNPNRRLFSDRCYRGVVCEVGPDWVELAAGWEWVNSVSYAWGSKDVIRREVYDNSKPLRISTADTRPGGALDCEPVLPVYMEGHAETHFVTELKVGDLVSAVVGRTREGTEWALTLSIERRPGGLIPPMHADPQIGTPRAAHLFTQACQDWEEKGIPLPKQYLDQEGRAPWTNPPYPPVAPEPHPAKGKP